MDIWGLYLLICHILSLIAFLRIIAQKQRTPTSLIAWILALAFIPYISAPLYFIIGVRKRKEITQLTLNNITEKFKPDCQIPTLFQHYGFNTASGNNKFKLYTDGVEAYQALTEAIKKARVRIYFSTYVLQNDQMTKILFERLKEKAQSGVEVKLLADSVGSWKVYLNWMLRKKLQRGGIDLEFFMPIFKNPLRNAINLRNHRKIYLIDNDIVFTGGMNLGNEYLGPDENVTSRWQDILFSLEGNVIKSFEDLFLSDWFFATGERLNTLEIRPLDGNQCIEVAPSGPDVENDVLYNVLMNQLYSAKEKIWIMTPYFIPPREIIRALIIAKLRGVDVKLIAPDKSNHLLADIGRKSYLETLRDANIDLCLFKGKMVHAKAILFDDVVMLGSVNLDYRSIFLNYELGVFFHSKETQNEIKKWMEGFILNSSNQVKQSGPVKQFFENIMKVVVPLL
ncbi:phospholipase D-like domain-containing protein [Thiotrichales bacterium 19S9-12]|nr:phospholipase D-like domain-containing protein [Thiotrichales bacterium 19S9-11]MCF6811177.1 phospholipase D-like domain-containing protein [Thiotrichales bacterium 19S9-12]